MCGYCGWWTNNYMGQCSKMRKKLLDYILSISIVGAALQYFNYMPTESIFVRYEENKLKLVYSI